MELVVLEHFLSHLVGMLLHADFFQIMVLCSVRGFQILFKSVEQTVDGQTFRMRQGYCSHIARLRGCWRFHSVKEAQDKPSSEFYSVRGCRNRWGSGGPHHDPHE